jgi:hypothetical protein
MSLREGRPYFPNLGAIHKLSGCSCSVVRFSGELFALLRFRKSLRSDVLSAIHCKLKAEVTQRKGQRQVGTLSSDFTRHWLKRFCWSGSISAQREGLLWQPDLRQSWWSTETQWVRCVLRSSPAWKRLQTTRLYFAPSLHNSWNLNISSYINIIKCYGKLHVHAIDYRISYVVTQDSEQKRVCRGVRVTLRLTVSQYVLVSSPVCGRLIRYCFSLKCLGLEFVVLFPCGALSDERPGLSFVSHGLVICLCVHLLFTVYCPENEESLSSVDLRMEVSGLRTVRPPVTQFCRGNYTYISFAFKQKTTKLHKPFWYISCAIF